MWYGTKFEVMRDHDLWRIAAVIATGFLPAALVMGWGWLRHRRFLPIEQDDGEERVATSQPLEVGGVQARA